MLRRAKNKRNPKAVRATTELRVNNNSAKAKANARIPGICQKSDATVRPLINAIDDEAPKCNSVAHISPLTNAEVIANYV
jgi:hypothetical protein